MSNSDSDSVNNFSKESHTNSSNGEFSELLNSSKDKNDNLELEEIILTQPGTTKTACRTCLSSLNSNSYLKIDTNEMKKLLNVCLPKIDLLLTKDPVMCKKCFKNIEDFYTFFTDCMKTEEELKNYCNLHKLLTPIDIADYLKCSVKVSNDFVTIKREDFFENSDEILAIGINVKNECEDADFHPEKSRLTRSSARKQYLKSTKRKFIAADLLLSEIKCEKCEEKFTSKWALDKHSPVHYDTVRFACQICNMKFKYKSSYEKHQSLHLTGAPVSKPFACDCGKYFNRKSKLKKHQEIHIKKEKPFVCNTCGKRFIEQNLLDGHRERVHIQEKPFSCKLCNNKYTSKAGLDVHFKLHFNNERPRPEPDLMCDICGKLFHRKYGLEKHRMSHTGDKPHECDQCDMKFKERYQLTIHIRRHTGEKPFKCEVCDFKFSCKNRLGVHMRKHTGVRPFPCQICNMAFARNDHLVKHIRAIHTGERPFECDICSKTFNRKDYLLKHKKVHSKNSGT